MSPGIPEQPARQSRISVAAAKRLIHRAGDIAIAHALRNERSEFDALLGIADQREDVNAFLKKRQAEWKNR
ncbi:MAG: enoyl-CoA hydratase/carnithine racemase [Halieaceae bacterium]|jgi:enoyl-CoA hydratase/carnithine racemase